ncbi:MAG: flagellar biosynthetic protein FliO [Pseudomonadales bacterium]|nr:flagellar biosynthetic protein FliO [Pseudomonadales bacterium]
MLSAPPNESASWVKTVLRPILLMLLSLCAAGAASALPANEPPAADVADRVVADRADTAGAVTANTSEAAPASEQSPQPVFRLKDEVEQSQGRGGGSDVLTMLLGLTAVLALVLGLAWLSRRFNIGHASGGQSMVVRSALSLGPKEKLLLVEVQGEQLLLGVTPQSVNLILRYPNQSGAESSASDAGGATKGNEFAKRMQALLQSGVSGHD